MQYNQVWICQKVLTVYISRVWTRPMVSLSVFLSKEIPKYCANKSQLVSKRKIEFHFYKICTRRFSAGLRVIKGRSRLKWGKVKLWSCKSERIVPIWGVVRKSKCQLGRKSGVSERRNPFLGFEQIWRLQIQRWGRLKLAGMLESEACFASFNPLFCKLAHWPLVRGWTYFCARSDWNCGEL